MHSWPEVIAAESQQPQINGYPDSLNKSVLLSALLL